MYCLGHGPITPWVEPIRNLLGGPDTEFLIFQTKRIATTLKSHEKNCDYSGKADLLRPKKGSNLFSSPPDEQNCDYTKIGRKELRLPWKNGSAAAEKGV